MATSIITKLMAMATMAIFIIDAEMLFLPSLAVAMRLAIKYSKFKAMTSLLGLKNTFFLLAILFFSCGNEIGSKATSSQPQKTVKPKGIITGAENTEVYLPLLKGKKVGVVTNQTGILQFTKTVPQNSMGSLSTTETIHLVDYLLQQHIEVTKIYAPEHGFRGTAANGELIKDGKDTQTGLPIISLYGNNKKPKPEQLKGIDVVVFDLQDVGARFYTYISTLHYVMEACAENNIPVIVLDKPNPNGHIIDGPILEPANKSFIGMHPIPVLHGMTIGEYAKMINGEKWLEKGIQCNLTVIPCLNYTHTTPYSLPVKPSPNLPNDASINLYPSLCFFEGTNVSVGRGTSMQFQIYGSPDLPDTGFSFTPHPNEGSKQPPQDGKVCYGENLQNTPRLQKIELQWLIKAYNETNDKSKFFIPFFTKLAGTTQLQKQIEQGLTQEQIRQTWQAGLAEFKLTRAKYLIYE